MDLSKLLNYISESPLFTTAILEGLKQSEWPVNEKLI